MTVSELKSHPHQPPPNFNFLRSAVQKSVNWSNPLTFSNRLGARLVVAEALPTHPPNMNFACVADWKSWTKIAFLYVSDRSAVYSNGGACPHPTIKYNLRIWVCSKFINHDPAICSLINMHMCAHKLSTVNDCKSSSLPTPLLCESSDVSVHSSCINLLPKWAV